jgi:hypothetical protein
VNKNNFIHGYNKDDKWPYSSLAGYLGEKNDKLIKKDAVLRQFEKLDQYKEYLEKNALFMQEKKEMEKYLIEE